MISFREKILCLFFTLLFASVVLRYCDERVSTNFLRNPLILPRRYLVDSTNCKIPDINPFEPALLPDHDFVKISQNLTYPLTYLQYDLKSGETRLKLNMTLLRSLYNEPLNCCVSPIYDSYWPHIEEGKCANFNKTFKLDYKHEKMVVRCFDESNSLVYQDSHITVVERLNKSKPSSTSKLNVLLIGLDSVSRLSMYRSMPKSLRHMQTSGWVEMRGYNKIGDNSIPNMMALLAGLPPTQLDDMPGNSVFDGYPFLWTQFSSEGYVTAYVEDNVDMETFNGYNKGFFRKPTDYYPRSFFSFRERKSPIKNYETRFDVKRSVDVLFNYLYDFVRVYGNHSFFGLFYTNNFHNGLTSPSVSDDSLLELLKRLESLGIFNNSFVALFSDHGLRVGASRTTPTGWYEDRLPLLLLSVPEWFKISNNPEGVYSTLLDNSEKLTSPFDLHMALKHILEDSPVPPKGCESCRSLFDSLEKNRSCKDAGIARHWCTCEEFLDIKMDDKRRQIFGNLVVKAINSKLKRDKTINPGYKCKLLELSKVLYVRKRTSVEALFDFLVGIETTPGGGWFEMTLGDLESDVRQYDTISRLNEYGNHSHCATKPTIKPFCFCEYI